MRTKAFASLLLISCSAVAQAGEPVGMTFDLGATGKTITNKFGDINMFSVSGVWTEAAAREPNDYFRRHFPFVQRIQLMAATGGEGRRDLFQDPNDRTTLTDYDFDRLTRACRNIVAKGLKPMVKTGWVPPKLSANPKASRAFRTNVRPPSDYDAYYAYIKAVAETLKSRFGLAEVKTWSWGVGVEYDNRGWFEADDGNAQTTKQAFFRLYDTTVAALEDALARENVIIGAHSMTAGGGRAFWDPREFVEHCAKGENLRRGGKGTRLDYLAFSYYTRVPGFNPEQFATSIGMLRDKAVQLGLKNLKYGVDEGRVLNGWDNKVIYPREVEHPMQSAGDAKLFHLMVEHDVDYFSSWSLTTEMLFGGLPVASAHLRNLAFRMNGSALLEAGRSGRPADANNDAGGLAGYDAASKTLRVLLYNFNRSRDANTSEDVSASIRHVRPSKAGRLTLRSWPLDEDHGNWWKAWQADMAERKMGPQSFRLSSWTFYLPGELVDPADVQFWRSRQGDYGKLAQLKSTDQQIAPGPNDTVAWRANLKPNAVVLYEVFPVEPARPAKASP